MKSNTYYCQILLKPEFSRQILKNAKKKSQIQNLMKIRPMVAIEYRLC